MSKRKRVLPSPAELKAKLAAALKLKSGTNLDEKREELEKRKRQKNEANLLPSVKKLIGNQRMLKVFLCLATFFFFFFFFFFF